MRIPPFLCKAEPSGHPGRCLMCGRPIKTSQPGPGYCDPICAAVWVRQGRELPRDARQSLQMNPTPQKPQGESNASRRRHTPWSKRLSRAVLNELRALVAPEDA